MQIFARSGTIGRLIILYVEPNDTIDNVKQKIQDQTGIIVERLELHFDNTLLENGRTLNTYGIVNDTVINYTAMNVKLVNTVTTFSTNIEEADVSTTNHVILYECYSIPGSKFQNCTSLKTIEFPPTLNAFGSGYIDTILVDVRENEDLYKDGILSLQETHTKPGLIDYIDAKGVRDVDVFKNCTSLTEIDLSMTSLKSISSYAFYTDFTQETEDASFSLETSQDPGTFVKK